MSAGPIPLTAEIDSNRRPLPRPVSMERARGVARVRMRADGATTRLSENFQAGSAKVRFPRTRSGEAMQVVLLNTAGGVTGGDHLSYSVEVEAGASGVVSTVAAERVYRRAAGVARIETAMRVGDGGRLDWLPQETIVFDRSALTRTLIADVHPQAELLAIEAVVLGRTAMGETARNVAVSDTWRVRRGGKLIFADGLRLDGDAVEIMAGAATGNAAAAVATLLLVAPDAEARIDAARAALSSPAGECGTSAWNGMLVARLIAPTGQALRADLMHLVETLRRRPMPRVWHC